MAPFEFAKSVVNVYLFDCYEAERRVLVEILPVIAAKLEREPLASEMEKALEELLPHTLALQQWFCMYPHEQAGNRLLRHVGKLLTQGFRDYGLVVDDDEQDAMTQLATWQDAVHGVVVAARDLAPLVGLGRPPTIERDLEIIELIHTTAVAGWRRAQAHGQPVRRYPMIEPSHSDNSKFVRIVDACLQAVGAKRRLTRARERYVYQAQRQGAEGADP